MMYYVKGYGDDLGWNIPVSLAKQVNSQGKNSIGLVIDNKIKGLDTKIVRAFK